MDVGYRKGFVCYLNDDDTKVEGFFEIVEENQSYIKIKSGTSIILVPIHRLLKMKEANKI